MRILYILKHDPWGIGGGCYASRNYFEVFTTILSNYEFDILCCEEFSASITVHSSTKYHIIPIKPMPLLTKLLSPLTHVMDRFHQTAKRMLKEKHYDWCIFDHSSMAGSLTNLCHTLGVKMIVLNHNCEYDYYRDSHPQWLKRFAILPVVKWNERQAYKLCDYNIFLTKEDKQQFKATYGESRTKSIIGGCFLHKGYQLPELSERQKCKHLKLIISGTIGNVQNMDGINNFLNELYPCIPRNIDIVIAGKNPPRELIEEVCSMQNIELIADPEDIGSIVRKCDVFLCPTRLGGGQKLRIMDGLLAGLPVIAHSVSARGYSAFIDRGFLYQYNDKNDFKKVFRQILEQLKVGMIDKQVIRKFSEEQFSFASKTKMLRGFLSLNDNVL